MSKTEWDLEGFECDRCNDKVGKGQIVDWHKKVVNGQVEWLIWCLKCVDDHQAGLAIDWPNFKGYCCDMCYGFCASVDVEKFGWTIDPDGYGIFCPWCKVIREGGATDPAPLSCLPKSQELHNQARSKGGIPIWLQGAIQMGTLVSIGMSWHVSALFLGLLYTGMVIWRRSGRTKSAYPRHQKREEPKCPF